jgi:fibronectin type 3 domain-containing protein
MATLSRPAAAVELFVRPAGSGASCTQAAPCALAGALAAAATDDTIYLAAGTYTGGGAEVALLDRQGLRLLGGWDGASAGALKRDPIAHEAVLDGENARRVVSITAAAVTVDGCTLRRGDASGTGAECGADGGCGGGVFVSASGATISACRVENNTADSTVPTQWELGMGGGVMGFRAHGLTVRDSVISGNVASAHSAGRGGGLSLVRSDAVTVARNRILDNAASLEEWASAWGGGIAVESDSAATLVESNVFRGNRAKPSGSGQGNALYTWYADADVRRNCIESDVEGTAVYLGYLEGSFRQNRVVSGDESTTLAVVNGVDAGAKLANNVIVAGRGAAWVVRASGYAGEPLAVALINNTIVGNGQSTGVLVESFATATMANTIVARNEAGIATEADASVTPDRTLFWANADDGVRGTNPIDGNPGFVNPPAGDFHIGDSSAARGAGIGAGPAADIDGDPRSSTGPIDVGADEHSTRWFDFGTPGSPIAWQYTQVTHQTTYSPGRGYGWLSGTIASRDRGAPDDLLRDFCFTPLGTFAVDLPNGRYRVTVSSGDAAAGHGQMGIYLEGALATTLTTAANEFKSPILPVSVADGQLTILLDDLGGSDVNVVINALTIERALPVRLDLGTASSPASAGYDRISHSSVYSPAAGAGWAGGAVQSRDRGGPDSTLRDFNFTQRGLFGLFLENGTYDVTLTLGDAAAGHDRMGVSVQGAAPDSITTARNRFARRRWRTCVADNRLELLLDDLGGTDANVVVNAVEVTAPPPSRFDFGTPTSNVEPGWVRVSEKTLFADGQGYGWSAGTVASRDRGTGTRLRQDFNFSRDAVFSVEVLDGSYSVTITMGDAAAAHDQMGVGFEAHRADTVSTARGEFVTKTYTVLVSDGVLDVSIADLGGTDVNAVINALEVR